MYLYIHIYQNGVIVQLIPLFCVSVLIVYLWIQTKKDFGLAFLGRTSICLVIVCVEMLVYARLVIYTLRITSKQQRWTLQSTLVINHKPNDVSRRVSVLPPSIILSLNHLFSWCEFIVLCQNLSSQSLYFF